MYVDERGDEASDKKEKRTDAGHYSIYLREAHGST